MLTTLALALLITGEDPDGVVKTAPRDATGAVMVGAVAPVAEATPDVSVQTAVDPQQLTTQQQIDRWIAARTPETDPFSDRGGPVDDRQVHGFVSGSIGTNDYSDVAVGVSLPIGERGRLDLSYSQTKNGWGYGYPGYYAYDGYGYGHGFRPGFGAPFRSGRSASLGYSWSERDGERSSRSPISAAD